jgi:hypothetical protein
LLKTAQIKRSAKYVDNKNRVYYRDGLNGRPDFILTNDDGVIFGIVEAKLMPSGMKPKAINQLHKQAAFYSILFGCIEAYTVFHPKTPKGKGYIVKKVTDKNIIHANGSLEIIKHNFELMLKMAQIKIN